MQRTTERTLRKLVYKDPSLLEIHPDLRRVPEPAEWLKGDEGPREKLAALSDHVAEHGVLEPLLIDSQDRVIKGRKRLRAAKLRQLESVPCLVVGDDEALCCLMGMLVNRAHLSTSGRAYVLYPLFARAHKEATARHLAILKAGGSIVHAVHDGPGYGPKVEDIARRMGVSRRLFEYAAQMHRIFDEDPEYKSLVEPKLLTDDPEQAVSLARAITGYQGRKSTLNKLKGAQAALARVCAVVAAEFNRGLSWMELEERERRKVWDYFDKSAAKLEAEERAALIQFHTAAAARLRKQTSSNAHNGTNA